MALATKIDTVPKILHNRKRVEPCWYLIQQDNFESCKLKDHHLFQN